MINVSNISTLMHYKIVAFLPDNALLELLDIREYANLALRVHMRFTISIFALIVHIHVILAYLKLISARVAIKAMEHYI